MIQYCPLQTKCNHQFNYPIMKTFTWSWSFIDLCFLQHFIHSHTKCLKKSNALNSQRSKLIFKMRNWDDDHYSIDPYKLNGYSINPYKLNEYNINPYKLKTPNRFSSIDILGLGWLGWHGRLHVLCLVQVTFYHVGIFCKCIHFSMHGVLVTDEDTVVVAKLEG